MSWWLDERVHAGPEHLDEKYVAGYDRKADVDPAADIATLQSYGLDRTTTVLDLGAGTGTFTLAAAPLSARVIAVDVSPAMVAVIRRRVADAGLDNVTVVHAGFLSYEHDGDPVDIVHTRHALHQLPDFWKVLALRHIAGILRHRGILRLRDLVYDLEPDEVIARMDRWLAGATTDPAAGWTATELGEHLRTEFSTFSWLFEPMLEHCGFEILDRRSDRDLYGTYTCRRI
jgi:SAM-dependent methyltransferase